MLSKRKIAIAVGCFAVALLACWGIRCLGDGAFSELCTQLRQVEHADQIDRVSISLSKSPGSTIRVELVEGMSDRQIETVCREIMGRMDEVIYYCEDKTILEGLHPGEVTLFVSGVGTDGTSRGMVCNRRVEMDEDVIPESFWWSIRNTSGAYEESVYTPYTHPTPPGWPSW